MITLAQLRDQQKANPPKVDEDGDLVLPQGAPVAQPVKLIDPRSRKHCGYTRLLPPGKKSVADVTQEWIEENWGKSSPWCCIEGEPEHPEFTANLQKMENSVWC